VLPRLSQGFACRSDLLDVTKPSPRILAGNARVGASRDEVVHALLKVKLELVRDVGANVDAPEAEIPAPARCARLHQRRLA
jgi:hypothetical protein